MFSLILKYTWNALTEEEEDNDKDPFADMSNDDIFTSCDDSDEEN